MICENCGKNNTELTGRCRYCGAGLPKLEAGNGFRDILQYSDDMPRPAVPQEAPASDKASGEIRALKIALSIVSVLAAIAIVTSCVCIIIISRNLDQGKTQEPTMPTQIVIPTETPGPTETPETELTVLPSPIQTADAISQTPAIAPADDENVFGYPSDRIEPQITGTQETVNPALWQSSYSDTTAGQPAEESTGPVFENVPEGFFENDDPEAGAEAEYGFQVQERVSERDDPEASSLP